MLAFAVDGRTNINLDPMVLEIKISLKMSFVSFLCHVIFSCVDICLFMCTLHKQIKSKGHPVQVQKNAQSHFQPPMEFEREIIIVCILL